MIHNYKYELILIMILIVCFTFCGKGEQEQTIKIPNDVKSGSIYLEPDIYIVEDKEYKSHRGIIVVSENRSKANSRLIEIPVVQIHSTGDSIAEPIFL